MKDVTSPVPIVGGITEGLGNAPIAQKIGGVEEEKGYLSQAYEYAGGAARTVYDAAGNAVRSYFSSAQSVGLLALILLDEYPTDTHHHYLDRHGRQHSRRVLERLFLQRRF